jgi:PhnB protein
MAGQEPAATHKNIMHAALTNEGMSLMASDMVGPGGIKKGNTVSLTLVCSSKEEIEVFFSRLSAGGKVGHALKEEFFGTYGDLTDKYGTNWMFQFDKNQKA